MKKILLIGGNGALGVYLREEALKNGYAVDVICKEKEVSQNPNLRFLNINGLDLEVMTETVKTEYDAIVDFMIYMPTVDSFKPFADLYLASTKQYLFISTYRVYGGDYPITEETRRIVDSPLPAEFVRYREYSYYKGKQEDYLVASGKKNYTILRPVITFSKSRFQLTILEADSFVWRMKNGKTVVLPHGAMDKEATISWAGDFGKSVIRLIGNEKAMGEAFTIGTSEHHTWREYAEMYRRIGGLDYVEVDDDMFIVECFGKSILAWQQLCYDRHFNRVVDNSKLLRVTGLKQSDFMKVEDALRMELSGYDGHLFNQGINNGMDLILRRMEIIE